MMAEEKQVPLPLPRARARNESILLFTNISIVEMSKRGYCFNALGSIFTLDTVITDNR